MQFLLKDVAKNVTDFNDIFDHRIGKVHDEIFSHFQSLRVKAVFFLESNASIQLQFTQEKNTFCSAIK